MPNPSQVLAVAAGALLPPVCHLGFADPARAYPLILPEDAGAMVPRRAAEFSAGRQAARMAMASAGLAAIAIPQGSDRAPQWPSGLVGSITHSRSACVAVVSRELRGLGLDIEPDLPLDPDVADLIRMPGDQVETDLAADPALLLFCAKEAAYKAQYSLSRRVLGPEGFAVRIAGGSVQTRLTEATAPFAKGHQITGRITLAAGHVLAVAWLE